MFPSFALVWPSNCASVSLTEMIAVSPLAHVLALEVFVVVLEDVVAAGVVVDHAGERRLEPDLVRAAVRRVDVVRKGEQQLGVAVVVLQRHLGGVVPSRAAR